MIYEASKDYLAVTAIFTAKEKGVKPKTHGISFYQLKSEEGAVRQNAKDVFKRRKGYEKSQMYELSGLSLRPCTG